MKFNSPIHECNSPVDEDFIWVAEYKNKDYVYEYDLITKQKNNLSDININSLSRFGIIGKGMTFYYEASSGIFKLAGKMFEASLKTTNYEFYLTGIVHEIIPIFERIKEGDKVVEYIFGYKTHLNINSFEIDFKVICSLKYGKPINLIFEAITNMSTDGNVRLRKNGEIIDEKYMILKSNFKNSYSYDIK